MKRAATFLSVERVFLEGLRVLSSLSLRPLISLFFLNSVLFGIIYIANVFVCVFYSIRKKRQIDNVE